MRTSGEYPQVTCVCGARDVLLGCLDVLLADTEALAVVDVETRFFIDVLHDFGRCERVLHAVRLGSGE